MEADAVVVGAGSFGASTAYHLAKLGQRVVLIDKHDLVSQTTPRAAGLTMQARLDPVHAQIARRSVEQITSLGEDTGEAVSYHQSGSLKLTRERGFVDQIEREMQVGAEQGLGTRLVSRREARELASFLAPEAALTIGYSPRDLYLEPRDLPWAYVRAARRLGATTLEQAEVTAIELTGGAVEAVVTDNGVITTPVVVDTAGAWNAAVGAMAGIEIPTVPTRHQLYVTEPIDGVTSEQPIVRVVEANVYVRPERGGLLVGGYEPDPLQVDMSELASGFSIDDLALDPEPLRRLTDGVSAQFPALRDAQVAELRGGLPTMTADGAFIIDRAPGVEGFFTATGCCVGGLSPSPAIGEAVAAWVVEGEPTIDLSQFAIARFGADARSRERLREECLRMYAGKYAK